MSVLALLLAQAVAQSPAEPADVVVIARKLDKWRGTITSNPLGTRCVTKVSTGDREIDAVGCEALRACWPDTRTRIKATMAKGVAEADRQRLRADAERDFGVCVKARRDTLVADLRDRRMLAAKEAR